MEQLLDIQNHVCKTQLPPLPYKTLTLFINTLVSEQHDIKACVDIYKNTTTDLACTRLEAPVCICTCTLHTGRLQKVT